MLLAEGPSSSNYLVSVQTMCEELDIQLNEIPTGTAARHRSATPAAASCRVWRVGAQHRACPSEHNPGQEIVATCAACWLATRETQERLQHDQGLLPRPTALAEAGLKLKNETPIKRMAEVLIEDIGYDAIGAKGQEAARRASRSRATSAARPTARSASPARATENPKYRQTGRDARAPTRSRPTRRRCARAAAVRWHSRSRRSLEMIKGHHRGRLRPRCRHDRHAPCPVCQMNVEVYQDQINATHGTKFKMPVVYSTLMSVAYGRSAKDAALNGQAGSRPSSSRRSPTNRTTAGSPRKVSIRTATRPEAVLISVRHAPAAGHKVLISLKDLPVKNWVKNILEKKPY